MHDKYKPVISPMVSELVICINRKNPLVKLNHTVLNRFATADDQINSNRVFNNKVVTIPDMVSPKDKRVAHKFITIVKLFRSE